MKKSFLLLMISCFITLSVSGQKKKSDVNSVIPSVDYSKVFNDLNYRCVGPTRGGRSTAVAGIASAPNTFFMGTTGGGVWRTDDAGLNWKKQPDLRSALYAPSVRSGLRLQIQM
ncbi:MAG: hypothetical protein ACO263_08255 [Cyclobacteriaceae bacterium]